MVSASMLMKHKNQSELPLVITIKSYSVPHTEGGIADMSAAAALKNQSFSKSIRAVP